MMAGVSFSHGTLSVIGQADASNTIEIVEKNGKINAYLNGTRTVYGSQGIDRISISGGTKADSIEIGSNVTLPTILSGGAGNDTIYGGSGNDAINGGAGNDRIVAGAGNDSINGGTGNDTMYGNAGNDFFLSVERDDKLVGGKGDTITAEKSNVPAAAPTVGSSTSSTTTTVAPTPIAKIRAISTSVPVGMSIHVDALASILKSGEWNNGQYFWTFGDAGTEENSMRGFNAAHTYDTVGHYTITLTVINDAGKSNTTTMTVNITPANRQVIYVSADGSDSNDGLSENTPIQSIAKAESMLASNTEILFRRGDTFDMTAGFEIHQNNLVIGAYGTGDQPQILWTASRDSQTMFSSYADSTNVTVQDITINTIYDQDINDDGIPIAMKPGGTNMTARRVTFLNVMYGMNMNNNPTGVLMQDDTDPLETGMRKYFAWVQGSHIVIDNCFCANSTREHIVRVNYVSMLNVSDNDFHNILYDSSEVVKTALNVQSGEFAYLYNNKLYSDFQVGPLGKTAGLATKDLRFNYIIGDSNEVFNAEIVVNHGAQHVTMRDNVVHEDNNIAINVDGYDTQYQRGVVDLTLEDNTAVNNGTSGSFLEVWGPVAGGLKVIDNLYEAPNLTLGSDNTAAVVIPSAALSSYTEIDGNIWPVAKTIASYLNGVDAINYVGDGYVLTGFKTDSAWNKMAMVGTDYFENATPTDSFSVTIHGVQVGAKLAA